MSARHPGSSPLNTTGYGFRATFEHIDQYRSWAADGHGTGCGSTGLVAALPRITTTRSANGGGRVAVREPFEPVAKGKVPLSGKNRAKSTLRPSAAASGAVGPVPARPVPAALPVAVVLPAAVATLAQVGTGTLTPSWTNVTAGSATVDGPFTGR